MEEARQNPKKFRRLEPPKKTGGGNSPPPLKSLDEPAQVSRTPIKIVRVGKKRNIKTAVVRSYRTIVGYKGKICRAAVRGGEKVWLTVQAKKRKRDNVFEEIVLLTLVVFLFICAMITLVVLVGLIKGSL